MALIAQRRVGNRLGRIELRAVERRPKPYPPPTRPRAVIREAVRVHGHAKNLKQAPFEPDRFAFTRRHARIVASANSTSVRSTRTEASSTSTPMQRTVFSIFKSVRPRRSIVIGLLAPSCASRVCHALQCGCEKARINLLFSIENLTLLQSCGNQARYTCCGEFLRDYPGASNDVDRTWHRRIASAFRSIRNVVWSISQRVTRATQWGSAGCRRAGCRQAGCPRAGTAG